MKENDKKNNVDWSKTTASHNRCARCTLYLRYVYGKYGILQLPDGRVLTFFFVRRFVVVVVVLHKKWKVLMQRMDAFCFCFGWRIRLLVLAWLNFIGGSECGSPKKDILYSLLYRYPTRTRFSFSICTVCCVCSYRILELYKIYLVRW